MTETLSHIFNGCGADEGLYICRLDRTVDLILIAISSTVGSSAFLCKHPSVVFFYIAIFPLVLCNISANSLDIVVVNESSGELLIPQVGCTFGHKLNFLFMFGSPSCAVYV